MYAIAEFLESAIAKETSDWRARGLAFVLGVVELRSDFLTGFFNEDQQHAYERGRELASRATFGLLDK